MVDTTMRLALPLLAAGQAQKELFHNEALQRLDIAVQPVVISVGQQVPPVAPNPGECWIAGSAPTGDWTGQADALCGWTPGGWRFLEPTPGVSAWSLADGALARWTGSIWIVGDVAGSRLMLDGVQVVGPRRPAVAAPDGGAVIDAEARATLAELLAMLAVHGLMAS